MRRRTVAEKVNGTRWSLRLGLRQRWDWGRWGCFKRVHAGRWREGGKICKGITALGLDSRIVVMELPEGGVFIMRNWDIDGVMVALAKNHINARKGKYLSALGVSEGSGSRKIETVKVDRFQKGIRPIWLGWVRWLGKTAMEESDIRDIIIIPRGGIIFIIGIKFTGIISQFIPRAIINLTQYGMRSTGGLPQGGLNGRGI